MERKARVHYMTVLSLEGYEVSYDTLLNTKGDDEK